MLTIDTSRFGCSSIACKSRSGCQHSGQSWQSLAAQVMSARDESRYSDTVSSCECPAPSAEPPQFVDADPREILARQHDGDALESMLSKPLKTIRLKNLRLGSLEDSVAYCDTRDRAAAKFVARSALHGWYQCGSRAVLRECISGKYCQEIRQRNLQSLDRWPHWKSAKNLGDVRDACQPILRLCGTCCPLPDL